MIQQTVLHRTSLFETHQKEGAKLVPFAGWEMPVEYNSILAEHNAVRNSAGLFDLSHMGELELFGAGAVSFLNTIVTNNVESLSLGQICYTVACDDSGKVIDDLLIYKLPEKLMLVVNASNREKIVNWIRARLPKDVILRDRTFDIALIAIQGPKSEEILSKFVDGDLKSIRYYWGAEMNVCGLPCLVSRTGYTGEDGFEIYVVSDKAPHVWNELRKTGIAPIGLGARDTLRLEACYALYGHEIDEKTSPLEAGLGWVVKFKKENFTGKNVLSMEKQNGSTKNLIAFKMQHKVIPRQGYIIKGKDGQQGIVTSGTFSPTLKIGIGLGFLPSSSGVSYGDIISVSVRDTWHEATVVTKPFHKGSIKIKD